jgi:UDP-GlcNAc:undecaprenyl-phosphate/decaprenyl-phosphate GlcNAc-1-phosphate transferase
VHNFNPASIFMGDTGAMLLGLLLGASGVSAVGGSFQEPTGGTFAALSIPVLVPILVLAVPFADTAWSIIRRLAKGRAVFSPDKQHLHHRLLEIGHSHRLAVLIMYYWSALIAFAAVGVSQLEPAALLASLGAGLGIAMLMAIGLRIVRRSAAPRLR